MASFGGYIYTPLDVATVKTRKDGHFCTQPQFKSLLQPEQILSIPCTTGGAAAGVVCELNPGAPRR
jgi:hypothetical protein